MPSLPYSFSLSFLLVVEQLERRVIRTIMPAFDQLQALSLVLLLQADHGHHWCTLILLESKNGAIHIVTVTRQFLSLVLFEVILETHIRTEPSRKTSIECLTLVVHKNIQLAFLLTLALAHALLSFSFTLFLLTFSSQFLLLGPPLDLFGSCPRLLLLLSFQHLQLLGFFSLFLPDLLQASLLVLADLALQLYSNCLLLGFFKLLCPFQLLCPPYFLSLPLFFRLPQFLRLGQLFSLFLAFLLQLILFGIVVGVIELVIGVPIERNETLITLIVYEVSLLSLPIVIYTCLLRIGTHQTIEEGFFWLRRRRRRGNGLFLFGDSGVIGRNIEIANMLGVIVERVILQFAIGEGIVVQMRGIGDAIWRIVRVLRSEATGVDDILIVGGLLRRKLIIICITVRQIQSISSMCVLILRIKVAIRIDEIVIRLDITTIPHRVSYITIASLIILRLEGLLDFVGVAIPFGRTLLYCKDGTIGVYPGRTSNFGLGVIETRPIVAPSCYVLFVDFKDGIEGGLADIATDVRLQVEEHFGQGKDIVFLKILEDGVELEHLAVHINLLGHIYSLEEIQTECIEIVQFSYLLGLAVPKHTLKPLHLRLQQGNVPVGLGDIGGVILYLPHHLHKNLNTLRLNHLLPDGLEHSVGLGRVGPHQAELLVICIDMLEELVHALCQDYPRPESQHLDLCWLVDLKLGSLFS